MSFLQILFTNCLDIIYNLHEIKPHIMIIIISMMSFSKFLVEYVDAFAIFLRADNVMLCIQLFLITIKFVKLYILNFKVIIAFKSIFKS